MAKFGPAGAPGTRRERTYHIIFQTEDGWARVFDVVLIVAILASVAIVMLDSVRPIVRTYGGALRTAEWIFTVLFTFEYALRLWSIDHKRGYALSFFGIIDLLSVIPTYLSFFLPGGQYLAVIRVLRVLRVFRVLKLARYVGEASVLAAALRASRFKISVFLVTVITVVIVVGSVMYLIEGPAAGFTSIPRGVYWAVVTLTTVGYGDIAPVTPLGQTVAAFVMILGYGIIAVPTGIITAELAQQARPVNTEGRRCNTCVHLEPDTGALYCRRCGDTLP